MRELNIDFLIKTPIEKLVDDIYLFFNEFNKNTITDKW